MALASEDRVFVRYDVPGPVIWHERLVLGVATCGQGWVIVLTPDGDVFAEEMSTMNDDLHGFRVVGAGQDLPFGIAAGQAYRIAPLPVGPALVQLLADGRQAAAAMAIPPGAPPGVMPVVAQPPLVPMAAPPGLAVAAVAGAMVVVAGAKWVYVETMHGKLRGDDVLLHGGEMIQGDLGLQELVVGQGIWAAIRNIHVRPVEEYRGAEAHHDARLLPLSFSGIAREERTWRDVSRSCQQVAITDWKLPGPRTTSFCVRFMDRHGGPEAHHRRFVSLQRLSSDSWGVAEHETYMKTVARLGEFDGVDIMNLVGVEVLLRKAQLIEYVYSDKGPAAKGGGKGDGEQKKKNEKGGHEVIYEASIFTGSNKEYGDTMVAPQLLEYVAKEVEKDAAVMKQVRKAREERKGAW
ncbi:unnamed protein product [Polarella glacialis]|uniref:Uncharacterized protein n=2 Tax=Polarella glacialis TaxID=89957 RepID=A0A813HGK6_POLGL|nr:unnamed protein product [Polarella glacialis]